MGILGTILGNSDVIKSGLNLIDDLHTSSEEMVVARTERQVNLLNSYAPFKVAQRLLALIFSLTFVGSYIMILTLYFLEKPVDEVQLIIETFKIDWIMLCIVSFYFGGGFAEGLMEKRMKK